MKSGGRGLLAVEILHGLERDRCARKALAPSFLKVGAQVYLRASNPGHSGEARHLFEALYVWFKILRWFKIA